MRDPLSRLLIELSKVSETLKIISSSEKLSLGMGSMENEIPSLIDMFESVKQAVLTVFLAAEKDSRTTVLMDDAETQKYTGAFWRKPTLEEMDAFATYLANDLVESNDLFEDDLLNPDGFKYDFEEEKAIALQEVKEMTMVVELPSFEIKIFCMCALALDNSTKNNSIHLYNSFNKYQQKPDGTFNCIDLEDYIKM